MRIKLGSSGKVAVFENYIYLEPGHRPSSGVGDGRSGGLVGGWGVGLWWADDESTLDGGFSARWIRLGDGSAR